MASGFNCSILWKIENYFVLKEQPREGFCVPKAEVVTFNSEKWMLTLGKAPGSSVGMKLRMTKTSGDSDMPRGGRLTILGGAGENICSVIWDHRPPVNRQEIQFSVSNEDLHWVFDIRINDLTLRIDLDFPGTDLALRTAVRTIIGIEKSAFKWSLKVLSEKGFTDQHPVPGNFATSSQLTLLFQLSQNKYFSVKRFKMNTSSESKDVLVMYEIRQSMDDSSRFKMEGHFFLPRGVNYKDIEEPPFQMVIRNDYDLDCTFSFVDGTFESIQSEAKYSIFRSENNSVVLDSCPIGESLFKNMSYSDVVLVAGGKEFKAHATILSNVSPVFAAMFDLDMSEKVTGRVTMEGVSPNTLKRMLKFVYTNEMDGYDFEQLEKLLAAAHKYEIVPLFGVCSRRMISLMTLQNVWKVLYLGHQYDDQGLKSAAKSLFSKHPETVLESKEWNDFIRSCFRQEETSSKLKKSMKRMTLAIPLPDFMKRH